MQFTLSACPFITEFAGVRHDVRSIIHANPAVVSLCVRVPERPWRIRVGVLSSADLEAVKAEVLAAIPNSNPAHFHFVSEDRTVLVMHAA